MGFKEKMIARFLAGILAFLVVANPLAATLVVAQEAGQEAVVPAETTSQEATGEDSGSQSTGTTEPTPSQTAGSQTTPTPTAGQENPAVVNEQSDTERGASTEGNGAAGEGSSGTAGQESAEITDSAGSSITTGDAGSQAQVENTINTSQDCLSGQTEGGNDACDLPVPNAEGNCGEDTFIGQENTASVAAEASSSANTGLNTTGGLPGESSIDTGEATAGAQIENTVNQNILTLEGSIGSENSGGQEVGEAALVVVNDNQAEVANQVNVAAVSGGNEACQNQGEVSLDTGEVLAWANIFNLLNNNIIGSDFQLFLLNLWQNDSIEVDLNKVYQDLLALRTDGQLEQANDSMLTDVFIRNLNQAVLTNEVDVKAVSGANQANENGDDVGINTGSATGMANVVNLVNINLVGSKFFFGIINIFGSFLGDLILPRPENFDLSGNGSESGNGAGQLNFINNNQAQVTDQVESSAISGSNEAVGSADNSMGTGNAVSWANTFSIINTNISRNGFLFLLINNLASWEGKILGWASPEAAQDASNGPMILEKGILANSDQGLSGEGFAGEATVVNENEATVASSIKVKAVSGENQANGNNGATNIKTGTARSLANLFNLVNLNVWGGRWFFGVINVLGEWKGDLVFAYPDLKMSLSGPSEAPIEEQLDYQVSYQNAGHDEAQEAVVGLDLPKGARYLADSSGLTPLIEGNHCSWNVGNLAVGESGSFVVRLMTDSSFEPEEISFWPKLVGQVLAADGRKELDLVVNAQVATSSPESDTSNNSSSVKTIVYYPEESAGGGIGEAVLPNLEVREWNNVVDFVYPGDTVTFEITVENKGPGKAYGAYLTGYLVNELPYDLGEAYWDLGDMEPGAKVVVSFGMKLINELEEGKYAFVCQAGGWAEDGQEISSDEIRSPFRIKLHQIASQILKPVKASSEEDKILGLISEASCKDNEDLLPYVLLFMVSSLWLVDRSRNYAKIRHYLQNT